MRVPKLTSWWGALALLAAVRVAIPLAVYASGASRLPGLPAFRRSPQDGGLTGDATGFYAATREFMAAWGRMPRAVLALDALFVLAAATGIVLAWRRRPALRPWLVAAALAGVGVAGSVDGPWVEPSGAGGFGLAAGWGLPVVPRPGPGGGPRKRVPWGGRVGRRCDSCSAAAHSASRPA